MRYTFHLGKARYVTWELRSKVDHICLMACVQDQAHLPNERISLSNLRRGKRVVERFLSKVAGISQQTGLES